MDLDDRRYQHPPSSGPPHLPMPRYPPDAPAAYDRQRYQPGPPPFDPRYPDQRSLSNPPSSLPAPPAPAPPNSAPPHLPRIQDGLYDRPPSSLPAAPPTVDYPTVSPLNGSPLDHPPLSAGAEYRPGPFHSPLQHTNGEPPPYSAAPAHYHAHPAHFPDYYSNHAIARSQRKPARAQQVNHSLPCLLRVSLTRSRPAINAVPGKPNATKAVPTAAIARRTVWSVSTKITLPIGVQPLVTSSLTRHLMSAVGRKSPLSSSWIGSIGYKMLWIEWPRRKGLPRIAPITSWT